MARILTALMTVCVLTAGASAGSFYNVNFSGDAAGNPPSTAPVAVSTALTPNTRPVTAAATGTGNSVYVQDSFADSTGVVRLSNKPVVFTYATGGSGNGTSMYFYSHASESTVQDYLISFDMVVSKQNLAWGYNTVDLRIQNGSTIIGRVFFTPMSTGANTMTVYSGNDSFNTFTPAAWQPDALVHVDAQWGVTDSRLKVYLNQSLAADIAIDSDLTDAQKAITRFQFGVGSTNINNHFIAALDNIVAGPGTLVIPEPATAAVLAGASLLLARRRR